MNETQLQALVYRAIDRANELLLEENSLAKEPGTILLGPRAALDSMGFVNFIVGLEDELSGASLSLNLVEDLNATGAWVVTVKDLIAFLAELDRKKSTDSMSHG